MQCDYKSLYYFPRALLIVGLILASAAALPITCFAACDQPLSTSEESRCADTAALNYKSINKVNLSTDTTELTFKVGLVTYKIPKNYIYGPSNPPVLGVTYPGFKPLTDETRDCFAIGPRKNLDCSLLQLRLHLPSSTLVAFNNFLENNKNIKSLPGPDGYKIYRMPTIEYYRMEDKNIFFHCMIDYYGDSRYGVCDDYFSLNDGNVVAFFFPHNQVKDVANIESEVRELMASFVVEEVPK
jgi:hypothetical protein